MKNFLKIFIGLILLGCSESEVSFEDLVERFQPQIQDFSGESRLELIADGSDSEFFQIYFNSDADINKISATAKLGHNTFLETGNNELKIKPYQVLNDPELKDKIIADVVIISSTKNAPDTLTINVNQYERKFVISTVRSNSSTVNLTSSSVSILNNFDSEVTLTATLSSELGNKVSEGTKVKFSDFLQDGSSAEGVFREQKLSSNENSQVSVNYNIGNLDPNQNITLIVEVLGKDGDPLSVKDSISLFVKTIQ